MEDLEGKSPIDIIRRMNPGIYLPTGQELADLLKGNSSDENSSDENLLVNQDDIHSPTFKEVRESISKNGYSWEEAVFFLTEDKRITNKNYQSPAEETKIERCPCCGDPLFGGECVICD